MSDMEQFNLNNFSYQFSGMGTDDLEASEYTLVTIAVDNSGSILPFSDAINKCMGEVVKACRHSPRAENLMIRVISFGSSIEEFHGFKLLMNCNPDDYNNFINGNGGLTSLNDAAINSIEAANSYATTLKNEDYDVNGLTIVITDGYENKSTHDVKHVENILKSVQMNEQIDGGLHSVLIGCAATQDNSVLSQLKDWQKEAGFSQYVSLSDVKDATFAKIANFISRSISSQSQSLATGGPSQSLSFDNSPQSSVINNPSF